MEEKLIRGVKVGLRSECKISKLVGLYDGPRNIGYAELYLENEFIIADIYYNASERIEHYRPVLEILNNKAFCIRLTVKVDHTSLIKTISDQLENKVLGEGCDYSFDD